MKSILRSRGTRETSLSYLLGASLVVVAGLVTLRQTFGQTNRYIVTELSSDDAGQVPCKINSLGDIAGRKDSPLEEDLERPSGSVPAPTPNIWELCGAAIIVPHQESTMQGKSSEYQIQAGEFFPSFGLQRVDCGTYRFCPVTAAAGLTASISTVMSRDILPART